MSIDAIFQYSFLLNAPFWFLMIFAPFWNWTKRIIASPWIAAPAAVLYTVLILPQLVETFAFVLDPSLGGMMEFLASPEGTTIAWAHFLVGDIFVGRWAYLDGREKNISVWLMGLILLVILLFGPLGFLLYLVARELHARFVRES